MNEALIELIKEEIAHKEKAGRHPLHLMRWEFFAKIKESKKEPFVSCPDLINEVKKHLNELYVSDKIHVGQTMNDLFITLKNG